MTADVIQFIRLETVDGLRRLLPGHLPSSYAPTPLRSPPLTHPSPLYPPATPLHRTIVLLILLLVILLLVILLMHLLLFLRSPLTYPLLLIVLLLLIFLCLFFFP